MVDIESMILQSHLIAHQEKFLKYDSAKDADFLDPKSLLEVCKDYFRQIEEEKNGKD
jgi:hypothetical protein